MAGAWAARNSRLTRRSSRTCSRSGRQLADQAKIGPDWTRDELDLIVADYFAMLAAEQAGAAYVKSQHSARLMAQTGRAHRSVEFKP